MTGIERFTTSFQSLTMLLLATVAVAETLYLIDGSSLRTTIAQIH